MFGASGADGSIDLVALAVPAFLLLIGVELLVSRWRGRTVLRFSDATADISCGVSNQLVELFTKAVFFALYARCYEWRLVDFASDARLCLVAGIVGVDFLYYWWHRCSHESNIMWAAHAVHHQSEDYNLAVALRQAWFTGVTSMPFYLPLAFLGVPPAYYALGMGVNLLYQFWIHTELIDRLGPFEYLFNTPSHHRVHHGCNPEYLDRNHAGIFIVWDKLFGTFEPERARPVYGTTKALGTFSPIWANLEHLAWTARLSQAAPNWRQAMHAWVAHPQWRPDGWREREPEVDLGRAKYDPVVTPSVRRYILGQQVMVLPAVFALLTFAEQLSTGFCLAATGLIITATAAWSELLDGRARGAAMVRTWAFGWAWFAGVGLSSLLAGLLPGAGLWAVAAGWIVAVCSAWLSARGAKRLSLT